MKRAGISMEPKTALENSWCRHSLLGHSCVSSPIALYLAINPPIAIFGKNPGRMQWRRRGESPQCYAHPIAIQSRFKLPSTKQENTIPFHRREQDQNLPRQPIARPFGLGERRVSFQLLHKVCQLRAQLLADKEQSESSLPNLHKVEHMIKP